MEYFVIIHTFGKDGVMRSIFFLFTKYVCCYLMPNMYWAEKKIKQNL